MKNEILEAVGLTSVITAASVETPISEKIWIFGLTGSDFAFLVAISAGLAIIFVRYLESQKLRKDIRLAEIKLQKLESAGKSQ